jgi:hypothetical protein
MHRFSNSARSGSAWCKSCLRHVLAVPHPGTSVVSLYEAATREPHFCPPVKPRTGDLLANAGPLPNLMTRSNPSGR